MVVTAERVHPLVPYRPVHVHADAHCDELRRDVLGCVVLTPERTVAVLVRMRPLG